MSILKKMISSVHSSVTANLFTSLTPDVILTAAESYTGLHFDGTVTPYNSYVNRVFGVTSDDGDDYIIKFYRPGRWTAEAIGDEHKFLADCTDAEVLCVAPCGTTCGEPCSVKRGEPGGGHCARISSTLFCTPAGLFYTVFPRLRARTFDIYNDSDWIRTGRAIGRMHAAAQNDNAPHRLQCTPQQTTTPYIQYLLEEKLVTPELVPQFERVCDSALDYIEEAYRECFGECDAHGLYHTNSFHRIHGDCHRGNILEQFVSPSPAAVNGKTEIDVDNGEQSEITFIDFDDMMTGPAMQDLWLLLPGYRADSMRELNLLLEGYEDFMPEQELRREVRLVEPLRFMRNIYFLAWTAIQHNDEGFEERNPDWGTKAFWEKEIEDLNEQALVLKAEYEHFTEM